MNLSMINKALKKGLCISIYSVFTMGAVTAQAVEPIKVGLVAALSGQSAKSGEAITRGLTIAIDEINESGGVLGRPLELVRRDDESNPSKGLLASRELIQREKVSVLFGGLDTPVSLAIVPVINQLKVPFMGVWAAGTPITKNGAKDNYAFRVSAVDEVVDEALVKYGVDNYAMKKPGMILINNPWGESNEKGLKQSLASRGIEYTGIERIESSDLDVIPQLTRLKEKGSDTLLMVANVAPSAQVVKSLERMGGEGTHCHIMMHGRSRMTIDPLIPTLPGRSTSGFHRPGRHCLHQARSAGRCSASRMKGESCIPRSTACEADLLAYG